MFVIFLVMLVFLGNTAEAHVNLTNNIINEVVPQGVVLKKCDCGYGVFATQPFKAGEIVYKHHYKVISEQEEYFKLRIEQGDFELNVTTHSVGLGDGARALYIFDSFMNHSCDPNTYSFNDDEMIKNCEYLQIATKDINIGDEITCDYNLFDYDCSDKNITNCYCKSPNCRKEIKGFKWLPFDEQIKLLPQIDAYTLNQFLADHPEILYFDLQVPANLEIAKDRGHFKIVSLREFQPGEIIYTNQTLTFKDDKLILTHYKNDFVLINNISHTINKGDSLREFFYFDSFMNHSCDPNTITFYTSENHYEGRALRPISIGDELTCDYEVFDLQADGEGFQCQCGAANCRGHVY